MGSNHSQQGGHHHRAYSRAATTTYSDMSTVVRHKKGSARILLERKCRFLGRFYAKELSEANLSRLRNCIRVTKGQKTKLRLTTEGIGSGSKLGTLLKNKMPAEFTPLSDIIDIFTDNRFSNILCIAMKFPDGNYEIQAYRMYDERTARDFQIAYSNVSDRLQAGSSNHLTFGYPDHNTSGHWASNENWMLKDDAYHGGGDAASRRSGLRKTTSLYDAFDADSTVLRAHNRSVSSPDQGSAFGFTSAKGNIGKKLADVSARDFDLHPYGPPDDDTLSRGSGDSNEELRWRLHNLSREVNHLKATMDDRHSLSGRRHNTSTSLLNGYAPREHSRSKQYVLTHHRDLDDKWSDAGSDASFTDHVDGDLVDSQAGTVKASVADYRPGGNTNQSNSHAFGSASTKIGQARRMMNGTIPKATSDGDILRTTTTTTTNTSSNRVLMVNNDPNHLVYTDEAKEVRRMVPATEAKGRYNTVAADPNRARLHSRARSTDAVVKAGRGTPRHRYTPSDASFHGGGGSTMASARVSRPVDKIYLPTGGGTADYYVINPKAATVAPGRQKYANSVVGAPRYDRKNRRR